MEDFRALAQVLAEKRLTEKNSGQASAAVFSNVYLVVQRHPVIKSEQLVC